MAQVKYVTNGKVSGVARRKSSRRFVFVFDELTGRTHKLSSKSARRMTTEEIEEYNSKPSRNDPTPEQIQERSRKIRSTWTDLEKQERSTFYATDF